VNEDKFCIKININILPRTGFRYRVRISARLTRNLTDPDMTRWPGELWPGSSSGYTQK